MPLLRRVVVLVCQAALRARLDQQCVRKPVAKTSSFAYGSSRYAIGLESFVPLKSSMIGVSAVGLTTAALLVIDNHFTHPQIVEHLAFGYMLPIAAVAMLFGSAAGTVATAVAALAAAFFLFPPKFSFWIDDPLHLAEVFWVAMLGYLASKAAGGLLRR